jgi:hypothetical protein
VVDGRDLTFLDRDVDRAPFLRLPHPLLDPIQQGVVHRQICDWLHENLPWFELWITGLFAAQRRLSLKTFFLFLSFLY